MRSRDGGTKQAEVLETTRRRLFGPFVNSQTRVARMLDEMAGLRPDAAFAVFADTWSSCEDTWRLRKRIAALLQHASVWPPVVPADRDWFVLLSNRLTIFRGCTRARGRGLSWTLDRSVAENHARGAHGARLPDPVIATCEIDKATVLFATTERDEAEILVDPSGLPRLRLIPFRDNGRSNTIGPRGLSLPRPCGCDPR